MLRHTTDVIPKIRDYISDPLIICTEHGLRMARARCYGEDEQATWETDCANAFTVDASDILWWAYADEVKALIEDQE